MTDIKILLGYLAIAIGFASYIPYLWSIYKDRTKPHGFTWFVWGVMSVVAFAAMTVSGAGPGAWEMAFNAGFTFTIAGIAFWQRHVKYVLFDWLALFGSLVGVYLWWLTNNPLYAVVLISLSDSVAFLPTYRKVIYRPHEEEAFPWIIGLFKYAVILLAIENYSLTNWLYPATVLVVDIAFVATMIYRQKKSPQQTDNIR